VKITSCYNAASMRKFTKRTAAIQLNGSTQYNQSMNNTTPGLLSSIHSAS